MGVSSRPLSDFERTKLCDLLFALPVIAWYCYAIARDYQPFADLLWQYYPVLNEYPPEIG